ncbi:MAG: futalosine hydrolase [Desulfobacteraceae bacterium]|jgi:futalosine hydrolase|nr:futalosine hydrolase [Desulfobacteraceae bacterium]
MFDKILIVSAVFDEIKFILKHLEKDESIIKNAMIIEKGKIAGRNTDILVSGPGILNAVHSLTVYLENNEKPDLIIQTGCAGGFSQKNISLGDIGIASRETYLHLGVENPENRVIPSPLPFSLTKGRSISNVFETNEKINLEIFDIIKTKTNYNTDIYPFLTVSEVTSTKERAGILFENYDAGMENMEGAGSAYVSFLYEIPFVEVRSASNETGERDKFKWDFHKAFSNSCDCLFNILKNI